MEKEAPIKQEANKLETRHVKDRHCPRQVLRMKVNFISFVSLTALQASLGFVCIFNAQKGFRLQINSGNAILRKCAHMSLVIDIYTGCPRRNVPDFGRGFLRSNYTDITQNTYIQSSMVTEILAIEKCGLLWCLRSILCP